MTDDLITTISSEGQVILPGSVRKKRDWNTGTRLVVQETPEGVLLKTAPAFKPTMQGSAFGMLKYTGRPKTIAEMDEGILEEARDSFLRSVDPDL